MSAAKEFPVLLEAFFTQLIHNKRSPNTIASYRDAFCLLFGFAKKQLHKAPTEIGFADLDAPFLGQFLDHLETERHSSPQTRNLRLAALRAFFRYAAPQMPEHCALIQRVLAIPAKRFTPKPVEHLSGAEVDALLASPDQRTWIGQRDHALLLLATETGLRVSELIGLCRQDVELETGAHVRCRGKGGKERPTPLRCELVRTLRQWLKVHPGRPEDPLFPSARGGFLSRDAVESLLAKHVAAAAKQRTSLASKRVSPHTLRHTTAMNLLQGGADRVLIARYLGHVRLQTTETYLHADLTLKEKALAGIEPRKVHLARFRAEDHVLAFLQGL